MMRADALNSHVYPVRTEMTGTKQIPISNICSTEKDESKSIIVDDSSTEESES